MDAEGEAVGDDVVRAVLGESGEPTELLAVGRLAVLEVAATALLGSESPGAVLAVDLLAASAEAVEEASLEPVSAGGGARAPGTGGPAEGRVASTQTALLPRLGLTEAGAHGGGNA